MKHPRRLMFLGAAFVLSAQAAAQTQAPRFEVEMLWPKPLPNRWILGSATGLVIDSRDHIFVVNHGQNFNTRTETGADQTPPGGDCCKAAPSVLEFDANGALVANWGGPNAAYQWPTTITGVAVDKDGNVWIGGTGGSDSHILKFARDGKFLATIGKFTAPPAPPPPAAVDTSYQGVSGRGRAGAADTAGRGGGRAAGAGRGAGGGRGGGRGTPIVVPANSTSMETFGGPAGISFNAKGDEAYIADGSRNRRVAVVDVATGAIKRYWGAYGSQPSDAAMPAYNATAPASKQFSAVTCAEAARDGMVYVCDRGNNRVQVFKSDGSFVKEKVIAPKTLGEGSVADVTFSRDAAQKYLYVADGMNNRIWVLDRLSLDVLTSFGDGGRIPGAFNQLHSIAIDSKGNLYTVETGQGKRVQKFLFKGLAAVPAQPKHIVWPGAGK